MRYFSSNKGVSFTEVIVASLLITITFAGISVMFMNAVKQLEVSSEQLQAMYLAREGIEIIRQAVRADLDHPQEWLPSITENFPQWGTLNYWPMPGDIEVPDFADGTREYRIVNVVGDQNVRCIDVRVHY